MSKHHLNQVGAIYSEHLCAEHLCAESELDKGAFLIEMQRAIAENERKAEEHLGGLMALDIENRMLMDACQRSTENLQKIERKLRELQGMLTAI